jgi:hypothetical protein
VLADESREETSVDVIASTSAVADDEVDPLAAVEVRHVGGGGQSRGAEQCCVNNVPGTVVTMMNPRHVRDVLIAGKVVYWKGKLVGWNVDALLRQIEQTRERVLARINGTPKVGQLPQGNNSFTNPYRPNFLAGCCDKGQNTAAPAYVLRP